MAEFPPTEGLITEARNPRTMHLDRMNSLEMLTVINEEDATVATAVRGALPQVARAVNLVVERLRRRGRVLYVGAGTSGRIGLLDALEWTPTFGTPPNLVEAVLPGDAQVSGKTASSLEDDAALGARLLATRHVGPDDVVIGIAASGRTPYVLGAVRAAREVGAATVGVSCNPGQPLTNLVDVPIVIVVGPEVIAGSTRMKAGTAQKMVLNMLSTAAMVQLGRVYSNLMVDLRPDNAKLRARAQSIVAAAAGISAAEAARYLEAAGDQVKAAIVMALSGCNLSTALAKLAHAGGRVREAIAAQPNA